MKYQNQAKHTLKIKHHFIFVFLLMLPFFKLPFAQSPQWRVFTMQNSPLPSNTIGRIVIDTNNIKWIGTTNGLVRIEGNNWTIFDTTNTPLRYNTIDPKTIDAFNNLWVGVVYKGMAKFDGVNWTIYDTTNSGLPSNAIIYIKNDAWNVKWIGTFGNKGLVRFDDTSWVIYNTTNSGIPGNNACALDLRNYEKWFGSCSSGVGKYNDTVWTIYNSTNSGLPSNYTTSIADDSVGNIWICTYGFGLAKFNTAANQWTIFNIINSGIPSDNLESIYINNELKYIGTQNYGFAIYNDSTWVSFNSYNSPLPGNAVSDFEIDKYGNLWICTNEGLAVFNQSGIIGIKNSQLIALSNYQLLQNYPNPFNPITSIEYEIKKTAIVNITVFDINGKELAVLVNSRRQSGKYKVNFDGTRFASGIYFYRMQSGDFENTKKMVLLK